MSLLPYNNWSRYFDNKITMDWRKVPLFHAFAPWADKESIHPTYLFTSCHPFHPYVCLITEDELLWSFSYIDFFLASCQDICQFQWGCSGALLICESPTSQRFPLYYHLLSLRSLKRKKFGKRIILKPPFYNIYHTIIYKWCSWEKRSHPPIRTFRPQEAKGILLNSKPVTWKVKNIEQSSCSSNQFEINFSLWHGALSCQK